MKARTAALLLAVMAHSLLGQERAPQNESITKEDLKADLFFLASDEMQGRLTGTRGNRLAAEFIKSRFQRLGLKPAGPDGSYFQPYDLMTTTLGQANRLRISGADRAPQRLQLQEDYYPRDFSASRRVRGAVVYVGFGITAPDLSYDDYAGSHSRERSSSRWITNPLSAIRAVRSTASCHRRCPNLCARRSSPRNGEPSASSS